MHHLLWDLHFHLLDILLSKLKQEIKNKVLKEKDKRMRATTEVIQNIKAIKLNSWIDYFVEKVMKYRNQEIFLTKISFALISMST